VHPNVVSAVRDNPPVTSAELGLRADAQLTLGGFMEQIGRLYGDCIALRFEGRSITYAELAARARETARALIAAGVGKGTRVAILMGNRPEWITATYGVAMAGGVSIPVNTYATPDERDYILRHSDAQLLLMQPTLLKHRFLDDLLRSHPDLATVDFGRLYLRALPQLRGVVALGDARPGGHSWSDFLKAGHWVPEGLIEELVAEIHPSDEGVIIYTSGTTDKPKGVLHPHRSPAIQNWRWAQQLALTPEDRVWSTFPYFWTAGFSMSLGGTLAAGATLVMQETFDAGEALELIETEHVTVLHGWPLIESQLAEHPSAASRDLRSLKRLMRNSPLRQLPGVAAADADPNAAYGLSETFTICTSIPSDSPSELRTTTHGVALGGMSVRVIGEDGRPLPAGESGEIAVKGVTLMRGYYKVAPEDFLDADGYFRTQDAGYLDAHGYLHWGGRLSGLIKTSGANVSPVEVEAAIARWGKLATSTVIGVPHPVLGEAVVVCAVARADRPVTEAEVIKHLVTVLAPYKVPKRVLFFTEEELSFTGSQKVRLSDLRDLARSRLVKDSPADPWSAYLMKSA
jgi:fatty-acyl-CoA synthase